MGRRPRASNETLIELFLDMIAAERGASVNTLDAYRRDLADFSADLTNAGETIAAADSDALRAMPLIAGVLTATEIDVLALICQGKSSKSIARLLQVSPRTIEKHRQHLGTKLGTGSPRALAAWVARQYALCGIAATITSG